MHKLSEALIKFLEGDVDVECLKVRLYMLPEAIETALNGTIKWVANVRMIADAMTQSKMYQNMLCEVNKILLLQIFHISCDDFHCWKISLKSS